MQTTYYTTNRMIWTEKKNKVVDLSAYRRQMEEELRADEWEEPIPAVEGGAVLRRRAVEAERRAWALDVCASLGVAVMTFTFALSILLG